MKGGKGTGPEVLEMWESECNRRDNERFFWSVWKREAYLKNKRTQRDKKEHPNNKRISQCNKCVWKIIKRKSNQANKVESEKE